MRWITLCPLKPLALFDTCPGWELSRQPNSDLQARQRLGWGAVGFKELVKMMVAHNLDLARRERVLKTAGYDGPVLGLAATGS
jgi:hypothetical protein